MTTQQMLLMTGLYLIALIAVTYFTRATARRIVGALVGGLAASLMVLRAIALCEAVGWWHVPSTATPYFLPLLYLTLAISVTPIYLVTWRLARRFEWRSLVIGLRGLDGCQRRHFIHERGWIPDSGVNRDAGCRSVRISGLKLPR